MTKTCCDCGSELQLIGSAGIVDYDGRWEAETIRYRCTGGHMIFVTEAAQIDSAETEDADCCVACRISLHDQCGNVASCPCCTANRS